MTKYLLLYRGPVTPPNAPHDRWPAWFASAGTRLIDRGSPMRDGQALHADGSLNGAESRVNGFSIVEVGGLEEARTMLDDHPYLELSDEHSIELFAIG